MLYVNLLQNTLVVSNLVKETIVKHVNEHLNILQNSCLIRLDFDLLKVGKTLLHLLLKVRQRSSQTLAVFE